MNEGYWIYSGLEKKSGACKERQIIKSPDSISILLRLIGHKRGDRIRITPAFVQRDNHFEFAAIYDNKNRKTAERYAFLSVCDKPAEEILPAAGLAKNLEDCADEDEKKLWLRIAAPVAHSSIMLRKEFQIINKIEHPYLEANKQKILDAAESRKILCHVYSSYLDNKQELTDLALQYAF